ncbi:gamma-glutamyl hydrolase A [Episyrphus balteatus]|uniref:gamma-glutamyl hydrolase A n=1 Tax=Episyrphus balteatus TaxID=286459 RepID=UPI0024853204|nr:gamma-glutamyl hydrolase A [Episyrphus balteatus]
MLQSRVLVVVIASAVVLLYCSPVLANSIVNKEDDVKDNDIPIVGILTMEPSSYTRKKFADRNLTSYLAASYVKFVEGAGARVVPIWIGKSPEYYKDIVTKINGVVLPGGATYFNNSQGYADAGYHIYNAAIELNEKGTYFPLWGVCLGFELIAYIESNRTEHRAICSSNRQPLPLEFVEGYNTSRLFGSAPTEVISMLKKKNVTANFHQFCITKKIFHEYGFDKNYNILSINHDWDGFEFISSIEHKRYPFYGVQFHPEKNLYEFIRNRGIPHMLEGILTSQYFAYFFVAETRKNMNKYTDPKEEENSLIYNFDPVYTGKNGSSFMQQYLFEGDKTAIPIPGFGYRPMSRRISLAKKNRSSQRSQDSNDI